MANSENHRQCDVLLAYPDTPTFSGIKNILMAGCRRLMTTERARDAIHLMVSHRINGLVTTTTLADTDGWRLLHLVRCGRFVPATLPVIMVCEDWQRSMVEPLAREHGAVALPLSEVERLPPLMAELLADFARRRPTALVIEDDRTTAKGIQDSLNGLYQLEFAYDGLTGWAAWQARQHALILLDLKLPGLSGQDILRQVMATQPSQAVVIITAHASDKNCLDLLLGGATEFIAKPFAGRQLREGCAKALHVSAYLQQCQERQREQALHQALRDRVHTAHYYLSTGLPGLAVQHLQHAQVLGNMAPLTDDEWINLLYQPTRTEPE